MFLLPLFLALSSRSEAARMLEIIPCSGNVPLFRGRFVFQCRAAEMPHHCALYESEEVSTTHLQAWGTSYTPTCDPCLQGVKCLERKGDLRGNEPPTRSSSIGGAMERMLETRMNKVKLKKQPTMMWGMGDQQKRKRWGSPELFRGIGMDNPKPHPTFLRV